MLLTELYRVIKLITEPYVLNVLLDNNPATDWRVNDSRFNRSTTIFAPNVETRTRKYVYIRNSTTSSIWRSKNSLKFPVFRTAAHTPRSIVRRS